MSWRTGTQRNRGGGRPRLERCPVAGLSRQGLLRGEACATRQSSSLKLPSNWILMIRLPGCTAVLPSRHRTGRYEASRDLEQSIALNDNRAAYRGRLLLDKDRAARGISRWRGSIRTWAINQTGINESTTVTQRPIPANCFRSSVSCPIHSSRYFTAYLEHFT